MRELIYCVVATSGEKVISVTARNSKNEHTGVFHKLLGVELNESELRTVNGTIFCDAKKLYDVLSYYDDFQQYKEIEFLKKCLNFLRSNENIENIKLSFYND
jgi:hypothetical protein